MKVKSGHQKLDIKKRGGENKIMMDLRWGPRVTVNLLGDISIIMIIIIIKGIYVFIEETREKFERKMRVMFDGDKANQ